jgi:hypothetical protein
VKRVQEWLCNHGLRIQIDSDFGPVTKQAVQKYQKQARLPVTGAVNPATYAKLVAPLARAFRPVEPNGMTFAELTMAIARQHLAEHPVETGGDNRGPWVRAYMRGNDGPQWLWCAGFVTRIMKVAADTLGVSSPIRGSFSCDALAEQARSSRLLVTGPELERSSPATTGLSGGAIFLVRRTRDDWTHTGFVTAFNDTSIETIEGNTNDEGSRNGYEVCSRFRGYKGKDYIRLG